MPPPQTAGRLTVAAIFRRHGPAFLADHSLVPAQAKALRAVIASRESFLFPVKVMGALFRGKFLAKFIAAQKAGMLHFVGTSDYLSDLSAFTKLCSQLYRTDWVVFAKRPFGGPQQVITYLSRYTHRVAISDARLREVTEEKVVISTRQGRTCTLVPSEFIRRFLLHVLPPEFRKIRHYGLMAPANVNTRLPIARGLLEATGGVHIVKAVEPVVPVIPLLVCRACGGEHVRREMLLPEGRAPPLSALP